MSYENVSRDNSGSAARAVLQSVPPATGAPVWTSTDPDFSPDSDNSVSHSETDNRPPYYVEVVIERVD